MHVPGEELCNCEFSLAYGERAGRLPSSPAEPVKPALPARCIGCRQVTEN